METAKAVVDAPSPYTGKVVKLYGAEGDVIETGAELADFEPDPNARQRAESQDTGHSHGPKKKKKAAEPEPAAAESSEREDEGTVVGAMTSGNEVLTEQSIECRRRQGRAGSACDGTQAQGRPEPRACHRRRWRDHAEGCETGCC